MTFNSKARSGAPGVPVGDVPDAAAYLTKRGINLDYASQRVTAIPAAAAKAADDSHPGGDVVRIAYHDIKGDPLIERGLPFSRERPLNAFGGGKFRQPAKTRQHLFLAPLKPKQKGKHSETWEDVANDTSIPIYLSEKEVGALAIGQNGKASIGLGGITGYMTKVTPGDKESDSIFLPDFGWIKWAGRFVIFVPDHDVPMRPELRQNIGKLGKKLKEAGAKVRIVELPDLGGGKTGADDFIAAQGFSAFMELKRYKLSDPRYRDLAGDELPVSFKFKALPEEWLTKKMPPTEYLVQSLIPVGTVALGVAAGGVGKTFLFAELCVCIAGRQPFLGRETKQGRVLFVAMEDDEKVLRRRLHTIVDNYTQGMSSAKAAAFRALVLKNVAFKSLVGHQLHLVTMDRGGSVVQSSALFRFIADIRDQGYTLVVLDPLARLHGTDENGSQVGTALVNAGERIKEEVGCNVLITHHTGKQNSTRTDAYASRGSSAIPDAARVVMVITQLSPDECRKVGVTDADQVHRGVLKLTLAKVSYASAQHPTYLVRQEDGFLKPFAPTFADDSDEAMLAALRHYCDTNDTGVSLTKMRDGLRAKIFGKSASKHRIEKWAAKAIKRGELVPVGKNTQGNTNLYRPIPEVNDE